MTPDVPAPRPGWTLRRGIGRTFVILAVVLGALATVLIVSTVSFATAGNSVIYRWQPAAAAGQRLLADLVNQETGVRGYLLSRQPDALRPYTDYLAAERVDRVTLTGLVRGDAAAMSALADVEGAAAVWQREIARPLVSQVQSGRRPDSSALDAGRSRFDDIRTASAVLSRVVAGRTTEARDARSRDGSYAGVALGLFLAIVVAAAVALWRGLHRWVLRPIDSLGEQTRHVARGELARPITPSGPRELTELGSDVEDMRAQIVAQLDRLSEAFDDLQRQGDELERSNADLQQFAYVASHDLSEPLRKVANFCQLLERQYGPQLDDRARQYIDFAVDGAKRMQVLIGDLLALSRVGRSTEEFRPLDLGAILDQAVETLSDRIAAEGATVERPDRLPTVDGDRALLTSLWQNLVGNAVKYHRDGVPPVITVSVEHDADEQRWTFTVADNGIGIDPQYAERIFAVFQRLHLRDQYGGTGIGLALCRKIVEFHGGTIWLDHVESRPGAIFRFTLPEGGSGARHSL
ncbi:MAG TPA: ATP-binding protein [Jatrophihabitans sp.]|uniref:sensor histidine kinase n=1 Tax=Jatrophihabitans sp. TaxID=1932789 RepID=UPI002E0B1F3A|nr:ATP-binding protein [Jatrophihabitans sp.]